MPLSDMLLTEFDQEMANTRKTMERVPEDKLAWRPHKKSPTMGWLATHLAVLPTWASSAVEKDSFDLAPVDSPSQPPASEATSRKELLEMFDKNRVASRAAIAGASDAHLLQSWSLLKGGKTVFTLPRIAVLRSFVMNHLIHHRAQLVVYLRMNDVPVPAIYGPSADEGQL